MKTNIRIPGNLYTTLYEEIMKREFNPENEYDKSLWGLEIEIGDFMVYLDATFDVEYDQDGCLEDYDIENIDVEAVIHFDENNNETDVTEQFDYNKFWNQFKRYVIKRNDIYIHHGDEVVVRSSQDSGFWKKMIYLYTDTLSGLHICVNRLGEEAQYSYRMILPATTGALANVGKWRKSYTL